MKWMGCLFGGILPLRFVGPTRHVILTIVCGRHPNMSCGCDVILHQLLFGGHYNFLSCRFYAFPMVHRSKMVASLVFKLQIFDSEENLN